jgi:tetratricopeptide (TPR) repeat protein/DNA-binding CsgD family transcriptional regulator
MKVIGLTMLLMLNAIIAHGQAHNRYEDSVSKEAGELSSDVLYLSELYLIDIDSAYNFGNHLLQTAIETKNIKAKSIINVFLADILFKKGKSNQALDFYENALMDCQNFDSPLIKAFIQYKKSKTLMFLSQDAYAIKDLHKALKYFEQTQDTFWMCKTYTVLGNLKGTIDSASAAKLYFEKALKLNKKLNHSQIFTTNNIGIGNMLMLQGQYDSAVYYLNLTEDSLISYRYRGWLAAVYSSKGIIYRLKDSIELAEEYYNKSLSTLTSYNDSLSICRNLIMLGELEHHKGFHYKGIETYHLVYNIAKRLDFPEELSFVTLGLGDMLSEAGTSDKAIRYYKEHIQILERLNSNRRVSAFTLMEIEQEMEMKQRELELETKNLRYSSQRKNLYILILTVLILSLGLAIYLIKKAMILRHKKNQLERVALNKELEYKNKEVTLSVMTLVKKNESIQHLINQMQDVLKDVSIKDKRKVASIINDLKSTKDDKIWEEFELRFQDVYTGFFQNLRSKFPDLTPSELKTCAFLRLNMSTKEIASILYKSPSSIEVERSRIRKKLGLTNTPTNLVKFLSEI